MVSFPNCKINLGLHVIRKRSDGFHDLETVFYPLLLRDAIEIIPAGTNSFTFSGLEISATQENNLCYKAYQLLKKDFASLPSVQMHLHKKIPVGAGLGGGSADGAFMLQLLNKKFQLGLSTEKLLDYALQLGSDCPFFIVNKPCLATGRGEFLEPVTVDLSSYKFVLVNPGIHINTAWAFAQVTPAAPAVSIKQMIKQPVQTWKDQLRNDFEEAVFAAHPSIKKIKTDLYNEGAVYASMTGSGSTVFGIFKKEHDYSASFNNAFKSSGSVTICKLPS